MVSLPSRGAWIEISEPCSPEYDVKSRSPRGERGLKFNTALDFRLFAGRSPHGERGLKSAGQPRRSGPGGRSPHGERGLKYTDQRSAEGGPLVAPRTGSVD